MNDEVKIQTAEPQGSDTAKLVAAIILVIGGIVAFYVLKSRPEPWASWVAMFGAMLLGVLLFAFSRYGSNFWQFFLESRVELRKVFWPTRQETFTTSWYKPSLSAVPEPPDDGGFQKSGVYVLS